MRPDLLKNTNIKRLTRETARSFSPAISSDIPDAMRQQLQKDVSIFAGFKTYHQLKEASEHIRTEDGSIKDFNTFYRDTNEVRGKYNRTWALAEYNLIKQSATMAGRWAEIVADKELYDLKYVTKGDSRVRADHAALDGIVLPVDDPFWLEAYPPNGWNCRCSVLQVPRGSEAYADSAQAVEQFRVETEAYPIFRHNPGATGRAIPPKHPYYGQRGYDHCTTGDTLAASMETNEECQIIKNLLNK